MFFLRVYSIPKKGNTYDYVIHVTCDFPFVQSSGENPFHETTFDLLLFMCNPADRLPFERDGGYKSALDGLIVRGMNIQNAGGECVRLRGEYDALIPVSARF